MFAGLALHIERCSGPRSGFGSAESFSQVNVPSPPSPLANYEDFADVTDFSRIQTAELSNPGHFSAFGNDHELFG